MQPTPPTTRTPPGHPGDPGSTPPAPSTPPAAGKSTPTTQTVYGITVYLKSQIQSSPMGVGVKVLAADPTTAQTIVSDAFGDDILNMSAPVTIVEGVYTESDLPPAAKSGQPAQQSGQSGQGTQADTSSASSDQHKKK